MRTGVIISLVVVLAACASQPAERFPAATQPARSPSQIPVLPSSPPHRQEAALQSDYPDLGPAPEITGDVWLNSATPLRLADLRGKVVLVDMWTFGCINCRNVIPSLRGWHENYASEGLVVIGNHYPEFNYEHDLESLRLAVADLNVPFPVVQDNEGDNWRAYNNRYWPTLYLIDKYGRLRYTQIGEGRYEEIEAAIRTLLAEAGPVD